MARFPDLQAGSSIVSQSQTVSGLHGLWQSLLFPLRDHSMSNSPPAQGPRCVQPSTNLPHSGAMSCLTPTNLPHSGAPGMLPSLPSSACSQHRPIDPESEMSAPAHPLLCPC
ncbi:hypothetical protein AAFF_G00079430 [Aldrovandia affinis]|uniref:Uncharacterized protein n=1 Tax=Aldrovandia affinis TaxID=143900 RepID=A0AAD7RXP3_9TELE|nr:hypothetical protein AAFF_G00079430 [Aldrovandia affinis]